MFLLKPIVPAEALGPDGDGADRCVVLDLVPVAVGTVIDRRHWVPHVTVLGNVHIPDAALDSAVAVVSAVDSRSSCGELVVGREELFGPDLDVLVDLADSPLMRPVHDRLLDALESRVPDLIVQVPAHARDGFRPHRTRVSGAEASGTAPVASTIALVELAPRGREGFGIIAALFDLGRRSVMTDRPEPRALQQDR